jgi:Xaa-Pro aminopeptidase
MDKNEYGKRRKKYREAFGRENIEALFFSNLPDVHYLCGFTGSNGNILLLRDKGYFFTDSRYAEQASLEVQGLEVIVYESGLGGALAGLLEKRIGLVIGFDPATLTYAEVTLLKKGLRGIATVKPVKFSPAWLRARKSKEELKLIEQAVREAEGALLAALSRTNPDSREADLALDIDTEGRRRGAEGSSFETIVASGARGSMAHAKPTRKKLRGATVIDWGILLDGYCTDMTRTISFGKPAPAMKKIHSVVLEAQEAAIRKIGPGVKASRIDQTAREIIEKAGYGGYFGHSLGHGVGLEVHERPYIAKTSRDILEEGMVLTIEPGIYLPGKGGVRVEDMVVVTRQGPEMLSSLPRDLALDAYV